LKAAIVFVNLTRVSLQWEDGGQSVLQLADGVMETFLNSNAV
jgi:hypothetical protein